MDHGLQTGLQDDDHDTVYVQKVLLTEQGDIVFASAVSTPAAFHHGDAGDLYQSGGHAANPSLISPEDIAVIATGWVPAGETWTYASADDPTYTFTIVGDKTSKYYAGMKIKLTQTSAKYFIVTNVAYGSPNTTITIYGGTDYDLASAAITLPYYSMTRAPAGFPMEPTKWMVSLYDTDTTTQSNPVQWTVYNIHSNSLSIPIGSWLVRFVACVGDHAPSALSHGISVGLSTENNGWSDKKLVAKVEIPAVTGYACMTAFNEESIVLTSKTVYFLNAMVWAAGLDGLNLQGAVATAKIEAICVYL
jgi:hypothetical protein